MQFWYYCIFTYCISFIGWRSRLFVPRNFIYGAAMINDVQLETATTMTKKQNLRNQSTQKVYRNLHEPWFSEHLSLTVRAWRHDSYSSLSHRRHRFACPPKSRMWKRAREQFSRWIANLSSGPENAGMINVFQAHSARRAPMNKHASKQTHTKTSLESRKTLRGEWRNSAGCIVKKWWSFLWLHASLHKVVGRRLSNWREN